MRLLAGLCLGGPEQLPAQGRFHSHNSELFLEGGSTGIQSRAWNEVQCKERKEEAVEDVGSSHNQGIHFRDPVDPACPLWLLFFYPKADFPALLEMLQGDTERSPALLQPP